MDARHRRTGARRRLALAFGVLLAAPGGAPAASEVIDDTALPGIGEPADRTMTEAEEARLGELLRARVYGRLPVSEDPEANAYLRGLGARMLAANGIERTFDFLIVEDPAVNAFAMPGGLLAFNTGLIARARRESELAGVVAHELAHVTQRHIARLYDQMAHSHAGLLTGAGVLLAGLYQLSALLPAAYLAQATELQRKLNYTRANEREADRAATRYLARSGIDPRGVADFFEVLERPGERSLADDYEYLSTHPFTPARQAEAEDRARRYAGEFVRDSESFRYIRARVEALQTPPRERIRQDRARREAGEPRPSAERYGVAVARLRQDDPDAALALLRGLAPEGPAARLWIALAVAEVRLRQGRPRRSLALLEPLLERHPAHYAVELRLLDALLAAGEAERALALARARVRRGVREPRTFRLLAEAADAAGRNAAAHMALADFYTHRGQYRHALHQLELAQGETKIGTANQARIDHRRADVLRRERESRR